MGDGIAHVAHAVDAGCVRPCGWSLLGVCVFYL